MERKLYREEYIELCVNRFYHNVMPKYRDEHTQWLDLPHQADLWDDIEAQFGLKIC